MSKLAISLTVLVISYLIFFGYVAETYPELPAKIASHFDVSGKPNGWMSRGACVEIMTAVAVLIPALVIGGMAGAGRIPVSFLNRPHRDFWLVPERRKSVLALLLRYSIWFATLNVLFLTGRLWLTVQANLHGGFHMNFALLEILAVLYLAATGIWLVLLVRRVSRIK